MLRSFGGPRDSESPPERAWTVATCAPTRTIDADAWAARDDRMRELRAGHLHVARRLAGAGGLRAGLDAARADLTWALTSVPTAASRLRDPWCRISCSQRVEPSAADDLATTDRRP